MNIATANLTERRLKTSRLTVQHMQSLCGRDNAPRVLLLGGSNFDLRLKRNFLNSSLATHCDIATYEPRGIGRTEQPSGEWTMTDYAEDALAVMDALKWQTAHILGESFGGMTALHVACIAPEKVISLTLSSATAGGKHASFDISQFLELSRKDAALQAMCLQDTRYATLRTADPEAFAIALHQRQDFELQFANPSLNSGGYARLLSARLGHDCTKQLKQIYTPTTVIAGSFDMQARPEAQKHLAVSMPNANFYQYDAGHGVLFTTLEATDRALATIKQHTPVV
ncbi:MAG: alpha/beta fold hydrolase [Granulosicoccus sp.]